MEADTFRSTIKEILKEALKEILQEEGLLQTLSENKKSVVKQTPKVVNELKKSALEQFNESQKKLSEGVKKSRFTASGFDPFSGTEPLTEAQASSTGNKMGPLKDRDPSDAGVDVSSLIGGNKQVWKTLVTGKKK